MRRQWSVCVELDDEQKLLFRQKGNVRKTLQFIEGFRQLCQSGLIMHHLQSDFSLTEKGFQIAEQLNDDELKAMIQYAVEIDH